MSIYYKDIQGQFEIEIQPALIRFKLYRSQINTCEKWFEFLWNFMKENNKSIGGKFDFIFCIAIPLLNKY